MNGALVEKTLRVSGMACSSCERRINERLAKEPGIAKARADYGRNALELAFDPAAISLERIGEILADMEYGIAEPAAAAPEGKWRDLEQAAGPLLAIAALYALARRFGLLDLLNIFPEVESGMGYGMIFAVGLLTSAHCLAMCGGINLSQAALRPPPAGAGRKTNVVPVLLYGLGRVISYTVIGAAVGGLGSAVSFSGNAKGAVQIAAGLFMMIMGLNILGVFPWLRRLVPHLPKSFSGLASGSGNRGPLIVGLLNGLMPCGPLQAMQLYALSTGSPVEGALSMLAFSLGTLPLTMSFGVFASFLGRRFMGKAIRIGAVLVFFMGLGMLGNGLTLSGLVAPAITGGGEAIAASPAGGVQVVETRLLPGAYQAIRVQAGMPLRWTIKVEEGALNGCNNRVLIPEFNIERKLAPGDNVIEFTPGKAGVYPYMCWMGMIASRIVVGDAVDTGETPQFDPSVLPEPDEDYIEDVPWL